MEIRTKLEENLETRRRHGGAKERGRARALPICIPHGCQEISPFSLIRTRRDLTRSNDQNLKEMTRVRRENLNFPSLRNQNSSNRRKTIDFSVAANG